VRGLAVLLLVAGTATAAPKKPAKDAAQVHHAAPTTGSKPAALVNLHNQWTNEFLAVDPSALPPAAMLDAFLRDHYTNRTTRMDPKLLQFLLDAAAHFHSTRVDIVSGFRHPKFNLILRKKGHQVARDSQHSHGNAVDFFIPHVATRDLHAWAKAQHAGGVGLYLESGFVYMDTGPVRYWSGD
jgi:uncharacterized protein YcbK (DUF882 family)